MNRRQRRMLAWNLAQGLRVPPTVAFEAVQRGVHEAAVAAARAASERPDLAFIEVVKSARPSFPRFAATLAEIFVPARGSR